jgi:phosphatidylserine/phosphatidylglycerophosphate/cardiolipin synthase-like enzyme
MQEMKPQNVTIHSKTILIDPFSENPVLLTGSHNMGGKASKSNDDNLNIIIGNKELSRAYAIHMTAVYNHYRWRFYRSKKTAKPKWNGNVKSDVWQSWYSSGENLKEIKFWTS